MRNIFCLMLVSLVFFNSYAYAQSVCSASSTPPALNNPLIIEISDSFATKAIPDFDRVGCEGLIHEIRVPSGRDVKVVMADGSGPLRYPLWVTGGNNAHLVGIEMRPVIQAGCDIGEGTQTRSSFANIHPRIPGNKAFRLQQSGRTFVEGVDIDLMGAEADCFVSRNATNQTVASARATRHISFVNTRCVGIEGLDDTPFVGRDSFIGDGIHGDFFQNQGSDSISSFTAENVTIASSSNGVTLHEWNGVHPDLRLKNFEYAVDPRYYGDDSYESSQGLPVAGGGAYSFENVYLDEPRGLNYLLLHGNPRRRLGPAAQAVPGISAGTPPATFAPASRTGLQYISPFDSTADLSDDYCAPLTESIAEAFVPITYDFGIKIPEETGNDFIGALTDAISSGGAALAATTIAVLCTTECNFGDLDGVVNIVRVNGAGQLVDADGNFVDADGNESTAPVLVDDAFEDAVTVLYDNNATGGGEFDFAQGLAEAIFEQLLDEQLENLDDLFADLGLDGDLSALTTPESDALAIDGAELAALDAGLERWRINFRKMTAQFNTGMIAQIEAIGMFFDAKHQLETQRIFQKRTAQAHKDYHPSEQMCEIGTFVRNLADTERRADLTLRTLNNQMIDRALGNGNVKTVAGNESDELSRREHYITTYCDINDNAIQNEYLCRGENAPRTRKNRDISYTDTIDIPMTLNVDFNDPGPSIDEENIFSLLDNIFMNDAFPFDSQQKSMLQGYVLPYEDKRSLIAMRSVAQNSFANIIAKKAMGPEHDDNAAPYLYSLMREFGIMDELIIAELGVRPSYHAQMEILTKKIYQNPDFVTNLYDKPANVKRIRAAMSAIKLMQDRDIHEAMMRREMLLSMILELDLRKKQKTIDDEFSNFTFDQ